MKKSFWKLILAALGAMVGLGSCDKCRDCFEVSVTSTYYPSSTQRVTYCPSDFDNMTKYNNRRAYFENQCASSSSYYNCNIRNVRVCDK